MKKSLNILCLVLLFHCINSIRTNAQNLDSLWSTWENTNLADTTRANALNSIIYSNYAYEKPDSGIYYAQMLYDFTVKKGLVKQRGLALNLLGISYLTKGELDVAEDYFKKSFATQKNSDCIACKGFPLFNLAETFKARGDLKRAEEYLLQRLEVFESEGDDHFIVNGLTTLANFYLKIEKPERSIFYRKRTLQLVRELKDSNQVIFSARSIGELFYNKGLFAKALEYFFVAESFISNKESGEIGYLYALIGTVYEEGVRDYQSAMLYYQKATSILEKGNDKTLLGYAYLNEGSVYGFLEENQRALYYLEKGLNIAIELNDNILTAMYYARMAKVYDSMGQLKKALDYNKKALAFLEEMSTPWSIGYRTEFLAQIGLSFFKNGDFENGVKYCEEGYLQAINQDDYSRQKENCHCLYTIYNETGQDSKALKYLQKLSIINDTLNAKESSKNIQKIEFEKQLRNDSIAQAEKERLIFQVHQQELLEEENRRNLAIGASFVLLLAAGGFYFRWRFIKKSRSRLQVEKDRSENLLLNILPEEIAEELKEKGKADARDFEMASILFTDFKGFTEQSAKLSAAELVNEINHCFEAFDGITAKYDVEKIKTIGDAYMAAGGLPVPTDDSVKNTVLAALEMQEFIVARHQAQVASGKLAFEMRVGIHTGPVVAGIVGVKKFQYDIWGDTVNTASRMESTSEVGKVNISQATYELLKDDADFVFENRGKIEAKGKGLIPMWFVSKS